MRVGLIDDYEKLRKVENAEDAKPKSLTELRYYQALVVLDECSEIYDECGVAFETEDLRLFSTNPYYNGFVSVEVSSKTAAKKDSSFVWQMYPGSTNELQVSSYEEYCNELRKMDKILSQPEEQEWQQSLEQLYNKVIENRTILESSEHGSKKYVQK